MRDRSRLPPLNALRGFEAAARLASFAKAADELALTQSAVSHQVRQLEAALGQQLFRRLPRELVLTDAGRDFLATVREALEVLGVGFARLAPYKATGSLVVSADAAFARFWLRPRLTEFRRQQPDIDVWLDTSERLVDFDRQEVELVIGRLRAVGEERIEVVLFDDHLCPCRAATGPGVEAAVTTVEDLARTTLVHDERRENWLMWLRAVGARTVDGTAGPHYSDPGLAIEAAVAGEGVALVSDVLALAAIESGALVPPFGESIVVPGAYRLAYPRSLEGDAALAAFAAFVRAEAAVHRSRLAVIRAGRRGLAVPAAEAGGGQP